MFLANNRAGAFDDYFISLIHVMIHYEHLG